MGSCFFLVQFYIIWSIVTLLVGAIVTWCKVHKLTKAHDWMKKDLFWAVALRFVFESYLELSICVTIGLINLHWSHDNFSITYCSLFTLAFAIIVALMPLITSVFYFWNH